MKAGIRMKQVYICHDTVTGIFSALYDAWKEARDKEAGIELKGRIQQRLFCEYKVVTETEHKAQVLQQMIKRNMGWNTYWDVYRAVLSDDDGKGEAVFRMMQEARTVRDSTKIMDHLGSPDVAKVFELSRRVSNEAHIYKEFIRFRELENGVLFSEISPKNQVLTCIAEHFEDRFPLENWMIYDKTHETFLIHRKKERCRLVCGETLNKEAVSRISKEEKRYEELWKGFFGAISIKERENPKLQQNRLPKRYRREMTEFSEKQLY